MPLTHQVIISRRFDVEALVDDLVNILFDYAISVHIIRMNSRPPPPKRWNFNGTVLI